MIPKKIPGRGQAQPGCQTTFTNFDYSPCGHDRATLVRIECGAGGIQFRKYCLTCWRPLSAAIPHVSARDEQRRCGVEAPIADLQIIHATADCYARRERNGGLA